MIHIPVLLIVILVSLINLSHAQQNDEALFKNLDGEYKLVDIKGMLNITKDPAFLADICPAILSLSKSVETKVFGLRIGSADDSSRTRCGLLNNSSISMTFKRVQPAESANRSQETKQQTISTQEISAFFPVLLAFSPEVLVCPNRTEIFTQVLAQDTGYWYTLLNHYKSTGEPLGAPFNETNAINLNALRGMYSLNLAVDFENGLGCTYLKSSEESRLRVMVDEVLAPSPTPTPSNGGSNDSTCFPSEAKVELADGSSVSMKELKIGDMVRDSSGSTSKVLLFTHAEPKVKSEFVIIYTSTAQVALSGTHYIYMGGKLLPAAAIKVGDEVTVVKRRNRGSIGARVVKVEREVLSGLYNPQTASGSIVVSWRGEGVLTSTYTTALAPVTAHALLGPLRFLGIFFDMTVPQLSQLFNTRDQGKVLAPSMIVDSEAYPASGLRRLSIGASVGK